MVDWQKKWFARELVRPSPLGLHPAAYAGDTAPDGLRGVPCASTASSSPTGAAISHGATRGRVAARLRGRKAARPQGREGRARTGGHVGGSGDVVAREVEVAADGNFGGSGPQASARRAR